MKNRDFSYDWLRAFSAIMIVLCHIFQGFDISSSLGYYFGHTYVSVFLILSAYLLGIKHRERIKRNPGMFLITRMHRIIPTYYTYLTLTFAIIGVFGLGHLELKQVIGHYLFLNWFFPSTRIDCAPLPQLGHLWFMSCICVSYLLVVVISAIQRKYFKTNINWIIYIFITSVIGTIACSFYHFFVYPFVVLILYPLFFFKGDELNLCARKNYRLTVSLCLLFNVFSIIGFKFGMYKFPSLTLWSIIINASLLICCAPIIFNKKWIPTSVAFISSISFEIYLIHHAICLGRYSLVQYFSLGGGYYFSVFYFYTIWISA